MRAGSRPHSCETDRYHRTVWAVRERARETDQLMPSGSLDHQARPRARVGSSVAVDAKLKTTLHHALFDVSLDSMKRTGEVFPLGALFLVGAMIDMLAGLRFAPARDDKGQGERYVRFVREFFPIEYQADGLAKKLWLGLRCLPLHNFSSSELLADSDSAVGLHLAKHPDGRVILHWQDIIKDYEHALRKYWAALENSADLQGAAARRCERYPPLGVEQIEVERAPVAFMVTTPWGDLNVEVPIAGSPTCAYGATRPT